MIDQSLEGQGEALGPVPTETTARLARAVVYLRVSSQSQVKTDYDPEGISIPAQRQSCQRKAAQMGNVIIVDEYVEPGKSGTNMDKRPAFQQMLARIKEQRDVDYVIIYKLSRLNRNRIDDALTITELRKYGVTLISATESIDETPVGQLMHGILASFNEFRSAEDGADIRYKMGEKVKRGGTIGRAPLGYVNVRERFEGREVRSVAIDPERAPFVKLAFELYATGEYSLERLVNELTDRGLTTRPGRYPAGPVSDAKLSSMLSDRYYLGYVRHADQEYRGRHDALIDQDLFDRVQKIQEARRGAHERDRVHRHYLKGSLWCGACHEHGVEARLHFQRSRGNGGQYDYFVCSNKHAGLCAEPHLALERVELAVLRHYGTLQFTQEFIGTVRRSLSETLADTQLSTSLRRAQLTKELSSLNVQEENLLDLAAEGLATKNKITERLNNIERKRLRIGEQLNEVEADLSVGASMLEAALELLGEPSTLYQQVSDSDRRLLNQAIFEKLYVDNDAVNDDQLKEPFSDMVAAHNVALRRSGDAVSSSGPKTRRDRPDACHVRSSGTKVDLLTLALAGNGSGKAAMVEPGRIELPTRPCHGRMLPLYHGPSSK